MEVKWLFILILAVLLSIMAGILIGYKLPRKKHYDGTLLIGTIEDRDQFRFIFSTEFEDLVNQAELIMKIEKSQNPQAL